MKKIPKILLLYIVNLLIFILLFASNFFNAFIFKAVSVSIAQLPFPEILRTVLLTFWMIVPQSLILATANKLYFRLAAKKFLLVQVLFAISIVLILLIVFAIAK